MSTFGPLLSDLYSPALPTVQNDLNTSTSNTVLTLSIAMIGIGIGQFIFGPIFDKFPRKNVTMIVFFLFTLSSIGCLLSISPVMLIIFRLCQGILGGGAIVIARSIAGSLYEGKKLAKFLALLMFINGILTLIIPSLSGMLVTYFNWRYIFVLLAIVSIILLIASYFYINNEEKREEFKKTSLIIKDFGQLLQNKNFLIPLSIQSISYIMLFSYAASAPFITQKIHHFSPQQYSIFMTFISVGLILSSQISGKLVDYFRLYQILLVLVGVQVLGGIAIIISLSLSLPIWFYLISTFLAVVPVTGIGPIAFSIAMEERTGGSGNAASLLGLSQFIIGSVISSLTGINGAFDLSPYITIVVITIILLCLFTIKCYKRLSN